MPSQSAVKLAGLAHQPVAGRLSLAGIAEPIGAPAEKAVAAQRQEQLGSQPPSSRAAKPVASAAVVRARPVKIDPITDRLRVRGVAGLMCEIDEARAAPGIY